MPTSKKRGARNGTLRQSNKRLIDGDCEAKKNGVNTYVDPDTGNVWRKVLYERGKFPDNYTPDQCFLAAIERNKNLHKYTFRQCLLGASQVKIHVLKQN